MPRHTAKPNYDVFSKGPYASAISINSFSCDFADSLHSVPVAQMGNYQEYLKTLASPLREIDPDQPKRLHTFGNPFKQDKKVGYLCLCLPKLGYSCYIIIFFLAR